MSDRQIQVMQTPTISNNCNAVFHQANGAFRHAALPKKPGFPPFTGAAIGVVVGSVFVIIQSVLL